MIPKMLQRVVLVLVSLGALHVSVANRQAVAEEAWPDWVCITGCTAALAVCCSEAPEACGFCLDLWDNCVDLCKGL
jgi:hypothetical protein